MRDYFDPGLLKLDIFYFNVKCFVNPVIQLLKRLTNRLLSPFWLHVVSNIKLWHLLCTYI